MAAKIGFKWILSKQNAITSLVKMQNSSIDCTLFQKLLYLCNVPNVMSMPTKNIFAGFGLKSEFVNLIYNR